jgi:biopolymer transport protein TolR
MQRARHRPNQLISGIDVTAFVSIMLALVAMFILPARMVMHPWRGVSADLPRVSHPVSMEGADKEDAMIVAVTRDDRVFFRNDQVRPEELPAKIRASIGQGAERKVYIRADARAKYKWVAEILDNVRSAGVEKIGFLVGQRPPPPANPQ